MRPRQCGRRTVREDALASPDISSLLTRELDAVYRLAYHLAARPQDADDFVQETFLRAFRAADRFELNEYGPRPWLFKILHNVIATRYHAAQRSTQLLHQLEANADKQQEATPDAFVDRLADLRWDDIDEQIKQAIDELPIVNRMTFLLHAVEGLKYREIAVVMEVPVGTVMSRLSRAREALTARLDRHARACGWHRSTPAASEEKPTPESDER